MNINHQDDSHHPEKLDADAVCIQCGTVNDEGTLLCKACGNNLRDQRNRRMRTDQALELDQVGSKRRLWASSAAFILAVGLIISTLYNKEMIVNWLMDVNAGSERGPSDMWRGEHSETIDLLVADLELNLPTEDVALEARLNASDSSDLGGIYVLFVDDNFVGSANVLIDGEELFFGALLESGEELRGYATLQGNYYVMAPESGGMKRRRRRVAVRGVALLQGGGVVECMGDDTETRYSCLAYKLTS